MSLSGKRPAAGKRIVLLAISLMLAATLSAQTTNRITLSARTLTLSELFREIEKQTGSVVIFNAETTDRNRKVNLSGSEGTVTGMLDEAFSGTGQTYQVNGRYIIVLAVEEDEEPAPRQVSVPAVIVPQPTQAEFESDISDYTQRNLSDVNSPETVIIRYDTIRTERPHDGIFKYPAQSITPAATKRSVRTPFSQNTPPIFAIKTNLAWWAAGGTPNLAAEIGLGKKTSLEVSGGNNRWNLKGSEGNNKKMVHWVIKPEFRYWLCERFNGHFFGVHAFYGKYNVGGHNIPLLFDKEYRYEGDAWGGGISYGYHLSFAKRWGAEFTAGIGVARLGYDKYDCEKCGSEAGRFNKTYFGPTSLGVKLVFMIK